MLLDSWRDEASKQITRHLTIIIVHGTSANTGFSTLHDSLQLDETHKSNCLCNG